MPTATDLGSSSTPATDDLTPLERGISPTTLQTLRGIATPLTLARGDAVVHQGDEPRIAIVLDGLVAIRRTMSSGRSLTLALIKPGHAFGMLGMRANGRSRFDLVALAPARALLLPGPEVLQLATQDVGLATTLLDMAMDALELAYERLDAATFDTARSRLSSTLLAYETIVTGASSSVTRTELAGLIGTSREMLDRVLRDLERQSILCRRGRRIVVLDRAGLERLAGWTDEVQERRHSLRAFLD